MGQTQTAEGVLAQSKADLKNKVAIVTGSSTGIGQETARVLAKGGARVILACRGQPKADKAAEEIRKSLKDVKDAGTVEYMELDLMDLDNVRTFAQNFLALNSPLHYLICNAGIMATPYRQTKQGFESQFGTNHLGHFLLTNLLLDKLKASAPSRVVVVSSALHKKKQIYWDGFLSDGKGYSPFGAYGQSKVANVLFAMELDRRLEEEAKAAGAKHRVTVHSLHPGVIATDLTRDWKGGSAFMALARPFFKSIPQGAATTLYCALAPDLETKGGKYYADCAETKPVPHPSLEPLDKSARRLWEASEKLVGLGSDKPKSDQPEEAKGTTEKTEEQEKEKEKKKQQTKSKPRRRRKNKLNHPVKNRLNQFRIRCKRR